MRAAIRAAACGAGGEEGSGERASERKTGIEAEEDFEDCDRTAVNLSCVLTHNFRRCPYTKKTQKCFKSARKCKSNCKTHKNVLSPPGNVKATVDTGSGWTPAPISALSSISL